MQATYMRRIPQKTEDEDLHGYEKCHLWPHFPGMQNMSFSQISLQTIEHRRSSAQRSKSMLMTEKYCKLL